MRWNSDSNIWKAGPMIGLATLLAMNSMLRPVAMVVIVALFSGTVLVALTQVARQAMRRAERKLDRIMVEVLGERTTRCAEQAEQRRTIDA